jgi:four helix bundle protein
MQQNIETYRDLEAWKLAIRLTKFIYRASEKFPQDERFGLTSQIRRAAVSVASNIAEGWGRGTTSDYARFLRMARGSIFEVETQIVIARELGFIGDEVFNPVDELLRDTGRVLAGLLRSIEKKL